MPGISNKNYYHVALLVLIMAAAVAGTTAAAMRVLYDTAFEERARDLRAAVTSQARLIETIARSGYGPGMDSAARFSSVVGQVRAAHGELEGFDGEFTLAHRQGDDIVFLLRQRQNSMTIPDPVPIDSTFAEPMRRALAGSSGEVVALDYRGKRVLASYEPVKELGLGIVAKIDIARIRAPFVEAGFLVAGIAVAAMVFGTIAFFIITNPVLRRVSESEIQYRTLFEGSIQGIFIHRGWNLLFANRATAEILGYDDVDDLMAVDSVGDLIAPHDRNRLADYRARRERGEHPPPRYEADYLTKDGEIIHTQSHNQIVEWNGQRAVQTVIVDISGLKTAQKELQVSEQKFRNLFEHANDCILIIDPLRRRILDANHLAIERLGYGRDDLSGMHTSEIDDPESAWANSDRFVELKEVGHITYEHAYRRKDGTLMPVEISGRLIDQGGRTVLQSVARDISNRKKAEREIRLLSKVVEQSPVELIVTDPAGNIEYVNPRFIEVTGYTLEEIKGENVRVLKSGALTPHDYADLWKTISAGDVWTGELQNKKKNGELYWQLLSIAPVRNEAKGEIEYYVGVREEITERKLAEAEMAAARDRAENLNRIKTEFLANMSHELRSPLNAVIGFAQMMRTETFGPLGNEQYQQYATDIDESGQHLLSVINDLLDMSKIEAGEFTLESAPVDVGQVTDFVSKAILPRAHANEVTVRTVMERNDLVLHADERILKQILLNLLSNAVKFTIEGGCVTLRAGLKGNGGIEIAVEDTGIGMTDLGIAQALIPFGQVRDPMIKGHEGTGLGLPLSKEMVERHGETIEVSSQPKEGTTVRVRFPPERTVSPAPSENT